MRGHYGSFNGSVRNRPSPADDGGEDDERVPRQFIAMCEKSRCSILFHCLPLPAVQPAGEHAQHHLQHGGVDHKPELISRAGLKDVGRAMEHCEALLAQLLFEDAVLFAEVGAASPRI